MNSLKVIALGFCLSACTTRPISIVPIKTWGGIDTIRSNGKFLVDRSEYFLIKNYRNDMAALSFVDTFVINRVPDDIKRYNNFNMIFYKESVETNFELIKLQPQAIDPASNNNDLVYDYWWYQGKFISRTVFKNGKPTGEKKYDVTISPAPKKKP